MDEKKIRKAEPQEPEEARELQDKTLDEVAGGFDPQEGHRFVKPSLEDQFTRP